MAELGLGRGIIIKENKKMDKAVRCNYIQEKGEHIGQCGFFAKHYEEQNIEPIVLRLLHKYCCGPLSSPAVSPQWM